MEDVDYPVYSVEACQDLKNWMTFTKRNPKYPFRKDGRLRANCARRHKEEIALSYVNMMASLVGRYVRTIDTNREVASCLGIYLPPEILDVLVNFLQDVDPLLVLYSPTNMELLPEDAREALPIKGNEEIPSSIVFTEKCIERKSQ